MDVLCIIDELGTIRRCWVCMRGSNAASCFLLQMVYCDVVDMNEVGRWLGRSSRRYLNN